jgi:methylenetetrahydrofolate reductase (NADPH)
MQIVSFYEGERPTLSFEFFPPKTEAAQMTLLGSIDHLASSNPDFVSVTYGAGGSTRALSFETCVKVKQHTSSTVMAHLTCVCHTEEEIAAIAEELWSAGISNIMALRGDKPKDLAAEDVFGDFRYSQDLIRFLKSKHGFCIGSGCYPEGHTETPDVATGIEHLKLKIDAGCDFLVTQMFFDNANYFHFVERARAAGVNTPIVPGIMPITGVAQLDKFETKFGARLPSELREKVKAHEGDAAAIEQVGIDWAAVQCQALLDGGAPGIHFYTLNKSTSTVQVCKAIGLTGQPK